MEVLQIILGRYLLELVGASVRYIYINTGWLMGLNECSNFRKIWKPNKERDENSTTNHGVGVILFGVIVIVLIICMV